MSMDEALTIAVRSPRRVLSALCCAAALGAALSAQPVPGPQFQVNDHTTGNQGAPDVAELADGHFIVAWNGGLSSSLAARFFDEEGTALSAELPLNAGAAGNHQAVEITGLAGGGFAAAWQSLASPGNDTDGWSVLGRVFDATGAPLTEIFQVNTFTTDDQQRPGVAAQPGGFVIAWESYGSTGTDNDDKSIQARLYSPAGAPLGGEFQVNSHTTSYQAWLDVATTSGGDFVVAWTSFGSSPGDDTSSSSVIARRFAASGTPQGDDFQVNLTTLGYQELPALSFFPDGELVVAWPAESQGIVGRIYDAAGRTVGGEIEISGIGEVPYYPEVGTDAVGRFVVSWQDFGIEGDPDYLVLTRRGTLDGALEGAPFVVNSYTTGAQAQQDVAVTPDGSFLVVWQSDGSPGTDQSGTSVQGRPFSAHVFADGFESGDTSAWSLTIP